MEKIKAFWATHKLAILGWSGVVLLQGATLPSMIKRLAGVAGDLPPAEMVLMVWAGLLLYLIRAVFMRDVVYITSNAVGFFLNSVLLYLIATQ